MIITVQSGTHLQHSETSMLECFYKLVNSSNPLTTFTEKLHDKYLKGSLIPLC